MIPTPIHVIRQFAPSWLQPAPYQSPARPYPIPQVVPSLQPHPMDLLLANALVEEPRPE